MPALLVTGLTMGLAVAVGRGADSLVVGAAVLAGQLSVGWGNDAVDARRDSGARRTDKPTATGEVEPQLLALLSVLALIAAVPLSWWAAGPTGTAVHLVAIGAGWAYNLGLKATVVSWAPYTVAFALLPAFVWLGLPGAPWPPWWVTVTAGLLGTAVHLVNALPDRALDIADGTTGVVTRLPARTTRRVTAGLVLAAVAVAVLGAPGAPTTAGWLGLLAAVALTAQAVRPPSGPGDRRAMVAIGGVAAIGVLLVATAVPS